jgi:hypothetical protein
MMRDGVIEYLRLAIEELVDSSRSSRNMNAFVTKNLTQGTVGNFRCFDDSHIYGKEPRPMEMSTICMSNPRQ